MTICVKHDSFKLYNSSETLIISLSTLSIRGTFVVKGLREVFLTFAPAFLVLAISASYFTDDAHGYYCEVPPGVCVGQPYGYKFGINCASMPTQCGSCECDGNDADMCDLYDGTNPCPTPTSYPTPTPGPLPSFTFTPNTGNFGEITLNAYSSGIIVTIHNTSSVNATSCTVSATNPDGFTLSNITNCTNINAGADCYVTIKGHTTYLDVFAGHICIRCTGMPICPVEAI